MKTYNKFINEQFDIKNKISNLDFWINHISNNIAIEFADNNLSARRTSISSDNEFFMLSISFHCKYHKTGSYKVEDDQITDICDNINTLLSEWVYNLYDVEYNVVNKDDTDFYKNKFNIIFKFKIKKSTIAALDHGLI